MTDKQGDPLVEEINQRSREHFHTAIKKDALVSPESAEACLKDFIWLWEKSLEHRPSFGGVRRSFLLSKFVKLAGVYPPAAQYLDSQVAEFTQQIQVDCATKESVRDLASIYQWQGRNDDTVTVMETLLERQPKLAEEVGSNLWLAWIHTQRWDLFKRFPPSFKQVVDILRKTAEKVPEELRQFAKDNPEMLDTLRDRPGFPGFDALVHAYKMSSQDELAQQLLDQEDQLRAF